MMTCKPWDIAVVPFPFIENTIQKPRPILVISTEDFQTENGHFMAAMITTAKQTKWCGDTVITMLESTGLSHPSMIRLKLFSLPLEVNPRVIGMLDLTDQRAFIDHWKKHTIIG